MEPPRQSTRSCVGRSYLVYFSVVITSDNKHIVSGGKYNTIRIWNLHDKTQEAVLECHTFIASIVAITSDNKYIVSGWWDKAVR